MTFLTFLRYRTHRLAGPTGRLARFVSTYCPAGPEKDTERDWAHFLAQAIADHKVDYGGGILMALRYSWPRYQELTRARDDAETLGASP
jgi:hypothetical protein